MDFPIPEKFTVGGQDIKVDIVNRIPYNVGEACLSTGIIKVALTNNDDEANSESYILNTFLHELTHMILDTMSEKELSSNEKFVSTFSSFLTEAIRTMK